MLEFVFSKLEFVFLKLKFVLSKLEFVFTKLEFLIGGLQKVHASVSKSQVYTHKLYPRYAFSLLNMIIWELKQNLTKSNNSLLYFLTRWKPFWFLVSDV